MRGIVTAMAIASLLGTACGDDNSPAVQAGAGSQQLDDELITTADEPADQTAPASPGSEVATTDGPAGSSPESSASSTPTPALPGPTGDQQGKPTTAQPGGNSSSAPTQSPAPSEAPGHKRPPGKGVTDDTIYLGFHNVKIGAASAAVGAANTNDTDEGAIGDALVGWINARGGIAGRKVAAVHHTTEGAAGSWAAQAQAACSTFTEDNEVFAAVSSTVGGDDSLLACLASKDTPMVDSGVFPYDQPYFDEFHGLLYRPGNMLGERWARAYADGLFDVGFFEGAVVGLVTYDRPVTLRLSDKVLKPRLRALGLEVIEQVVSPPASVAGLGATGSEMSSAVLRFRAAGVNRVLFLENGGTAPFLFFNEAESQGYRPLYGLTSNDVPNSQADNAGPEQLTGARAIGWTPPNDTYAKFTGNAARDLCTDIMKAAGASTANYYAYPRCDAMFMLYEALQRATALDKAGLLAGVERLGGDYLSPFSHGSSFGPGKYAGADVVQPLEYRPDLGYFTYSDSPTRVS